MCCQTKALANRVAEHVYAFFEPNWGGMPGMLSVVNWPEKTWAAESILVLAAAVGVLVRWAEKSRGSDIQQSSKNSSHKAITVSGGAGCFTHLGFNDQFFEN